MSGSLYYNMPPLPLRPSGCTPHQTWEMFRDKGSFNQPPPPALPTDPERVRPELEKHFALQFASNFVALLPHVE